MFRRRTRILAILFVLASLGLTGRLLQLQIVQSDELRAQGINRTHRLVQVPPRRGEIKDRHGRVLAHDVPSFDLWLVPARQHTVQGRATIVSQIAGFSVARIVRIARSTGEPRALDVKLALDDLTRAHPLVDALAARVCEPQETEAACRKRVARAILDATIGRQAHSVAALTQPRPCLADIPQPAYMWVERAKRDPAGRISLAAVEPRVGTRRVYPYGALMGHITGYVGKLNREEYRQLRGTWKDGERVPGTGRIKKQGRVFFSVLPEDADAPPPWAPASAEMEIIQLIERRHGGRIQRYAGYFRNEMVGRSGVEQYYNQQLRGRHARRYLRLERPDPDGPRRLVAVGTRGQVRNGKTVALTINIDVQRKVHRTLQVALNGPRDEAERLQYGDMLENLNSTHGLRRDKPGGRGPSTAVCVLMNAHNGRIYALVSLPGYDPNRLHEDFAELAVDTSKPLLNRVIAGEYPPGSVIKPLIALGALQEERITPETEFLCEGAIHLGRHSYTCMHNHGHVNVTEAIMLSCNIFFYKAGQALRGRGIYNWMWDLSLGHPTGVDIAGERPGHLPHAAQTGRGWSLGNTYHLAIGQGPITATPLQIAVVTAAIANGGILVQPHVCLDNTALDRPRARMALDPEALAIVRRGMRQVVEGDASTARSGTGHRADIPAMTFAGKTGSAEWRGPNTHGWFACYAPFEQPEVVCVVLVPGGGYGGSTCAPIARQVLLDFFDLPVTDDGEGSIG